MKTLLTMTSGSNSDISSAARRKTFFFNLNETVIGIVLKILCHCETTFN